MLAWSEELITDGQKTRNHGYDVIVGGELFIDYLITLANCHAKPKTQINKRRTLPASFPLVGCLPQAVSSKRFSGAFCGRQVSYDGECRLTW